MFYLFYHDFSYRFSQYEWQILQGPLNGKFGDWRVAVYDVIFDKHVVIQIISKTKFRRVSR